MLIGQSARRTVMQKWKYDNTLRSKCFNAYSGALLPVFFYLCLLGDHTVPYLILALSLNCWTKGFPSVHSL